MQLQQEKLDNIIAKKQTVTSAAKELSVSRKTIYQWLPRYKKYGIDGLFPQKRKQGGNAHNRTKESIEDRVVTLAQQHHTEGVQSLADMLYFEHAITLHPTTIYRILKRRNVRYGPYHITTHKRWRKKLYTHSTPGKELQMDTTYPYGYKEGKVVYTIIDDASRWVYAKTYPKASALYTKQFLRQVLKRAPFTIQKIRTDNGTEFVNTTTKSFLEENNIVHRRNTVGCPEQNGKIERFHQTFKRVFCYSLPWNCSSDMLQYHINLFLHYYNYQKKHRGLGMEGKTPFEKLEESGSVNLTLQCYNS
jgi:transposase InsO family protein